MEKETYPKKLYVVTSILENDGTTTYLIETNSDEPTDETVEWFHDFGQARELCDRINADGFTDYVRERLHAARIARRLIYG